MEQKKTLYGYSILPLMMLEKVSVRCMDCNAELSA